MGAGTILSSINLLNNTSWSNKSDITSNPSELILPSGAASQNYLGNIVSGTGPYFGVKGVLTKTKDSSNVRVYKLDF